MLLPLRLIKKVANPIFGAADVLDGAGVGNARLGPLADQGRSNAT
jgi:hypothetical protein